MYKRTRVIVSITFYAHINLCNINIIYAISILSLSFYDSKRHVNQFIMAILFLFYFSSTSFVQKFMPHPFMLHYLFINLVLFALKSQMQCHIQFVSYTATPPPPSCHMTLRIDYTLIVYWNCLDQMIII